ncbi:hypothetical protein MHM88_14555 [Epibacterium sp. MM17-32]|uniref:hypothetical protein n=1 Tax=Epibacterium sp. MM17-32 TaxID=2917734 RepID=UPI001EF64222|nr:hypothetical protein [Epibacterium sp. MM17-32]MCG7629029.1 hypothetical protein [Epibacterium sp. MM17-32]
MTREIWIVQGVVTDPDAHNGRAHIGDTEWQFSDGPAGQRGSSADYLSLEEGMREHPGCIFHFDPEPQNSHYEFTVRFSVPYEELQTYWWTEQKYLPPIATMAAILQRDLYDDVGMSGEFDVLEVKNLEMY